MPKIKSKSTNNQQSLVSIVSHNSLEHQGTSSISVGRLRTQSVNESEITDDLEGQNELSDASTSDTET